MFRFRLGPYSLMVCRGPEAGQVVSESQVAHPLRPLVSEFGSQRL